MSVRLVDAVVSQSQQPDHERGFTGKFKLFKLTREEVATMCLNRDRDRPKCSAVSLGLDLINSAETMRPQLEESKRLTHHRCNRVVDLRGGSEFLW